MTPAAKALCAAALAAGFSAAPAAESLPLTIEQVWFRNVSGRSWIRLGSSAGDLTIAEDRLSFSTRKKTVDLPLERVRMITYGKVAGDVNTEWVLLAVGERRADTVVAIRDGRKLGYGGRTLEIFSRMKSALASLAAAQYRVPPGLRAFDDFDRQFTLAVPETWQTYLQSTILVGDRAPWGTILFSAEPIRSPGADGRPVLDEQVLDRVLAGAVPALIVERRPAEKGMGCNGFSTAALDRLLALATAGELLPGGAALAAPPTASPEPIDRCNGVRLRSRATGAAGVQTEVDLHVAAENGTLFVFGVRALPERYDEARATLDRVMTTVQFSVAE